MLLVNGKPNASIDATDRGFQFGDGLFETVAVLDEIPLYYSRHIERLKWGCRRLGMPIPDIEMLRQEVSALCQQFARSVIKIQITRGPGGRGYRCTDPVRPTRVLSVSPFPDYPVSLSKQGVKTRVCDMRVGINPALAGIKHTNRLEQIMARAEWQNDGIREGILLDTDNYVVEGTMTNIFLVIGGTIYTPDIDRCGVAGIMRKLVIELALQNDVNLVEGRITLEQLLGADECFLTNSIIEIWPIGQIDGKKYSIGPMAKRCSDWVSECNQRELACG